MEQFFSTRQVALLLGIKPDLLQRAIWQTRVDAPMKGPSGQYLWTMDDIQHASWALLHRAYEPKEETGAVCANCRQHGPAERIA